MKLGSSQMTYVLCRSIETHPPKIFERCLGFLGHSHKIHRPLEILKNHDLLLKMWLSFTNWLDNLAFHPQPQCYEPAPKNSLPTIPYCAFPNFWPSLLTGFSNLRYLCLFFMPQTLSLAWNLGSLKLPQALAVKPSKPDSDRAICHF